MSASNGGCGRMRISLLAGSSLAASLAVFGGVALAPATAAAQATCVACTAAFEFTPVIHLTLSAWHASTDVIAGRQADLDNDAPQGLWVRAGFDSTDRELVQSFTSGGSTFSADNSYEATTTSLIAGYDFGGSEAFYAGAHGGLLFSELEFEGSDTSDELTGPTVGLYAGWRAGALSVDGAVNANLLELRRSSAVFEDSVTNIITLGGRAEAGWRVPISDAFFVQPLVTAAYVSSSIDEVEPAGYDIAFEDARSTRAALGLRAGGRAGALGMWVVGRAWKEFSGDGAVVINNAGSEDGVTFVDDLSGDFQEVAAGLSFGEQDAPLTAFASAGARIADDIDNYSFSIGARLRW